MVSGSIWSLTDFRDDQMKYAMTIFAETGRTILREITMEDVDPFYEMDSDPEVHRYLGTKPIKNKDQIGI